MTTKVINNVKISYPYFECGKWVKWSDSPLEDLVKLLNSVETKPSRMKLDSVGNVYKIAQSMGIEVAFNCGFGVFNILEYEQPLSFAWKSTEGRSIDWLEVETEYNRQLLLDIVNNITKTGMRVKYVNDLMVVLEW